MIDDVMAILGVEVASRSTVNREVDDFYVTPDNITRCLLEVECLNSNVWECAVGRGYNGVNCLIFLNSLLLLMVIL